MNYLAPFIFIIFIKEALHMSTKHLTESLLGHQGSVELASLEAFKFILQCAFLSILFYFFILLFYFTLFASVMYFSKAIVIDGVAGVGARMSTLKP